MNFGSLKKMLANVALAATFMLVLAGPSEAQIGRCGTRKAIVVVLSKQFGEKRHALGLVTNQLLMELFVSPKRTWTLLASSPKGTSCIVATGESWDKIDHPKGPEA
ncbi:MAG: hypothetical protein ACE5FM_02860 [Methyloligellaceae bacterium]